MEDWSLSTDAGTIDRRARISVSPAIHSWSAVLGSFSICISADGMTVATSPPNLRFRFRHRMNAALE